ncbi:MAG TPA: hypothetical protein VLC08_09845, partial [Chitinolyticbacter sp.]|nr:hypothetical protein [Chitinolyticbacter sp.]
MKAFPKVSEREIYEDRQLITQQLDAAFLTLTDTMRPFQRKWDAGPKLALAEALYEGGAAGVSGWGEDFADLFKADTWMSLGESIKDAAGNAYDTAGVYAVSAQKKIKQRINDAAGVVDKADETLFNWAWWETQFEERARNAEQQYDALIKETKATIKTATELAEKAKKVYAHRDAILDLPNLIVKGDPVPVQKFVDTVLMDIDPALAKEIKKDPNFYMVLELIQD